jgi:hypothetical protein
MNKSNHSVKFDDTIIDVVSNTTRRKSGRGINNMKTIAYHNRLIFLSGIYLMSAKLGTNANVLLLLMSSAAAVCTTQPTSGRMADVFGNQNMED